MKRLTYWGVALLMALMVPPVWAGDVEPPSIAVEGEAQAVLEPDYIEWVVDIRTRDKLPKIARQVNNAIYESLLKIADKADIDEKQITSGEPAYQQSFGQGGRGEPEIGRYIDTEVYRRVTLVMRDMDEFDEMLDEVHPLGVFYDVRRKSTKYDETAKRVEAAALKDARMKAVDQAAALGQNIGKAIEVDVSRYSGGGEIGGLFGEPEPFDEDVSAAGPDGKIHVSAYASVRFRLD